MAGLTSLEIADRPRLAFVTTAAIGLPVYTAFQLAVDGDVNLLASASFAVVFAAMLVLLSVFRRRLSG